MGLRDVKRTYNSIMEELITSIGLIKMDLHKNMIEILVTCLLKEQAYSEELEYYLEMPPQDLDEIRARETIDKAHDRVTKSIINLYKELNINIQESEEADDVMQSLTGKIAQSIKKDESHKEDTPTEQLEENSEEVKEDKEIISSGDNFSEFEG